MVFHTAPPHPASKARITCSPVLVGGADASQKGFGEAMPAKFTARLTSDISRLQLAHDGQRGPLAVRNSIHDLPSTIHAISSGKVLWIRRLPGPAIDYDAATIQGHATNALQQLQQRRLADSRNDEVAGQMKLRSGDRFQRLRHTHAFQKLQQAPIGKHPNWQRLPKKAHALLLGVLVLECKRRSE